MSDVLYQRRCTVDVQRSAGVTVTVEAGRMAFAVRRDEQIHANTAEVRLWNLTTTTRSQVRLPCTVTVSAGYATPGPGVLFRGKVYDVATERSGADTVLVLRATDSATGTLSLSQRGPVAWATVAQAAVQAFVDVTGVTAGNAPAAIASASGPTYPKGYSARGPAPRELDAVLLAAGLRASVQAGALLVLDSASAIGPGQVVSLSASSGLLGSPVLAARAAPGTPPPTAANPQKGHVVKSRLRAELHPGSVVAVQSLTLTGQFRVRSVSHDGDTHGTDWTTTVELAP